MRKKKKKKVNAVEILCGPDWLAVAAQLPSDGGKRKKFNVTFKVFFFFFFFKHSPGNATFK